jgi:hypothetical protein
VVLDDTFLLVRVKYKCVPLFYDFVLCDVHLVGRKQPKYSCCMSDSGVGAAFL